MVKYEADEVVTLCGIITTPGFAKSSTDGEALMDRYEAERGRDIVWNCNQAGFCKEQKRP